MAIFRSFAAGAALVLVLAACGSEATTTDAAAEASGDTGAPSQSGAPITGSFATVAGGQVDLGALEGQDTVLWFWAPW